MTLGVTRQQAQGSPAVARFHLVNGALLGVDQRGQFGEQHLADRAQVALALQHAGEFGQVGLEPILFLVALSRRAQVADHRIDVVFEFGHLAARVHPDRAGQVALGHRGRHVGDGAHLGGEVLGHRVDVVGQILPGAGHAGHIGLAAQPALDADFAGDIGDLLGESGQGVGHVIDRFTQGGHFAFGFDGELDAEIAVGDGRDDFDDAAHLVGEVGRHDVDGVREVLPGAGHVGHYPLAAELAVGADFARHAGHFRREGTELVHHGVDGVLEFENLALGIGGNLTREVAAGHGRRHFGNIADLGGEVGAHRVDRVGQVLPGAGHAGHDGLHAQAPVGADFARHPRDFRGEGAKLLDHRVDGFLELQELAAGVGGDLAREVAVGDGDGDFGDIADLGGEIARHRVDVVGQVLPRARHARHLRLAAQLAFGADFTRHAADLGSEPVKLVHHDINGVLEFQDFAFGVGGNLAREVAAGDRGGHLGNVADLRG